MNSVQEDTGPSIEPSVASESARPPLRLGTFFRRLGPAGPLAIIAASAPALGGFALLASIPWLAPWLQSHQALGAVLYVGSYTLVGGLGFLPTYAYAVLGGYTFGWPAGLALAMASFVGASIIAYAIARRASGDRVVEMIEERPKWRAVYDALLRSGLPKTLLIVTLLRIPPNSPFALTNLTLAATRVHPLAFVVGTLVGMSPRTGVAVFIGAAFGLDVVKDSPKWLLIAGIVVTLVVLGILGQFANQAISRVTRAEPVGVPAPAEHEQP